MKASKQGISTTCVHGELGHYNEHEGVNSPIQVSSAFDYRGDGPTKYPRYFNTENQREIVKKLCLLESGEDGMLMSSGMAAISTALFGLIKSGDHVIFTAQLYGGTFNLIETEFPKFGIEYTRVDGGADSIEKAIKPNTKVIYIETPSNPLLQIVDIKRVAQLATTHTITTIIDNTFASPVNQNPLSLGMDIVIHSGTKYLGGHSDLCFGAIITSKQLKEKLYKSAINYGGSINGLDAYLIDRSLKTLSIRVGRQNENAMELARFLDSHEQIEKVNYPGLSHHPGHEIAKSQMKGFGGMLSFELNVSSLEEVTLFLDHLKIIKPAVSLGGVDTIICSPVKTSHIKMPEEERLKIGVTDKLLRLSVGVEELEDLILDIENALKGISKAKTIDFSIN